MPRAPFARIFSSSGVWKRKCTFCISVSTRTHFSIRSDRSDAARAKFPRAGRVDQTVKARFAERRRQIISRRRSVSCLLVSSRSTPTSDGRIGIDASLSDAVPYTDAHLTPPLDHGYVPRAVSAARARAGTSPRARRPFANANWRRRSALFAESIGLEIRSRRAQASRPPLRPRTDLNAPRSRFARLSTFQVSAASEAPRNLSRAPPSRRSCTTSPRR